MLRFKFIVLIIFFNIQNIFALELKCNFEEVYANGQKQEGILYFKDDKLRYQYLNDSLYTIFKDNDNFFIVRHNQLNSFQKISENTFLLEEISNIINEYPNIQDEYYEEQYKIKVEKSLITKFIKRISIVSENLNLSLFFYNCINQPIDINYFQFYPYKKINF